MNRLANMTTADYVFVAACFLFIGLWFLRHERDRRRARRRRPLADRLQVLQGPFRANRRRAPLVLEPWFARGKFIITAEDAQQIRAAGVVRVPEGVRLVVQDECGSDVDGVRW